MIRGITLFCVGILVFLISASCEIYEIGPTHPIKRLRKYKVIVIATVDQANQSDYAYQGLESFEMTVNRCLKGEIEVGTKVPGFTKDEHPRGVCPVHLIKGNKYLLLLE